MNTPPIVWILADDRAGNVSQVVGVAQALNIPYITKNIRYSRYGRLPNMIRGRSLWGVDTHVSDPISAPWPDILISAGRKTAPIARYIKKKSNGHTRLVHLMNPGFPDSDFDIIALPTHDRTIMKPAIVQTVGAPHKVTQALLDAAKPVWAPHFTHLPSPKIAVLVGGNTKKGIFSDSMAREFGVAISNAASQLGASLLVTVSRRTSPSALAALQQSITAPHFLYDPASGLGNPYMGYLGLADIIIASGDSISMCCEACSTGKPVYIYAPESLIPNKHQIFHRELYRLHHARPFEHTLQPFQPVVLDNTQSLAAIISKRLGIVGTEST